MAIRFTLHGRITTVVSVRSINWLLSPICVPFLCLDIGRASPLFKEGSVIGYGGRAIEVSVPTLNTFGLKLT